MPSVEKSNKTAEDLWFALRTTHLYFLTTKTSLWKILISA